MHRKPSQSPLQNQQGVAMILVLCLGGVFLALSAALMYAASTLTASANRQLQEQEAYDLAASFSEILEGELEDTDSSFYTLANQFLENYHSDNSMTFTVNETSLAGLNGADALAVTLTGNTSADIATDGSGSTGLAKADETFSDYTVGDLKIILNDKEKAVSDYRIDVAVTATRGNASFTYIQSYERKAKYEVYYTFEGKGTAKYIRDSTAEDGLTFVHEGNKSDKVVIQDGSTGGAANRPEFVLHYTDDIAEGTTITYSKVGDAPMPTAAPTATP